MTNIKNQTEMNTRLVALDKAQRFYETIMDNTPKDHIPETDGEEVIELAKKYEEFVSEGLDFEDEGQEDLGVYS